MHMAVTKRREEGGGRPPSRAAKLASLGVRPGDLSLLPVTQQGSDQDLAQEKQRRAQRKRKGKAKQLMMKHKQRVHKCIAYTAIHQRLHVGTHPREHNPHRPGRVLQVSWPDLKAKTLDD